MSAARLLGLFLAGTIGFVAITYFEQVPVLGWLGALVSVLAWATLARAAARDRAAGPVIAAALGAWTGLVGAWSAWAVQTGNLFGLGTAPLERAGAGFGFVGAILGLVYWPLVGAAFCLVVAIFTLGRRVA